MRFDSVGEAKEYVCKVTNKVQTIDDIDNLISYYRNRAEDERDDRSKNLWEDEVRKLESWRNSDTFKEGKYPQGIDELILELVEWRAMIFSFQNISTKREPLKESGFFAQWYLGAIYGIFTIIGKLVSQDERDNSLRKLWADVSPIMLKNDACTQAEVDYINKKTDKKDGQFTNNNSKVILFRNKLIAHNEASPLVEWNEVDDEISLLIRIWSLLTAWSSLFGLCQPFRSDEQAFLGLEALFQGSEISALKKERKGYLDKVKAWSKNYAHTGEIDNGRGAFSICKVEIKVTHESKQQPAQLGSKPDGGVSEVERSEPSACSLTGGSRLGAPCQPYRSSTAS